MLLQVQHWTVFLLLSPNKLLVYVNSRKLHKFTSVLPVPIVHLLHSQPYRKHFTDHHDKCYI